MSSTLNVPAPAGIIDGRHRVLAEVQAMQAQVTALMCGLLRMETLILNASNSARRGAADNG